MSCARVGADAREAADLAANPREVLAAAVPDLGEERDSAACLLAAPASAAVPRAGVLVLAVDLQAGALVVETRAGVSAAVDPALAVLLLTGEGPALAAADTRAVVLAASPLKRAMKVVLPTILVVGFQGALSVPVDPADFPAVPVQALAQVDPLDQIGRLVVPKPGQPPAVASTLE